MKLTEEKLRQLIIEELENIQELELDMKKRSPDPVKYFDSLVNDYMRGYQGSPEGKQELQAAKESIAQAVQSLEIKEVVIPVSEDMRQKYKGFILKAIKAQVEDQTKNKKFRGSTDFKVLKSYLYENIVVGFKEAIAAEYGRQSGKGLKPREE